MRHDRSPAASQARVRSRRSSSTRLSAQHSSAVGLQQVYLDNVDNLRLGDARPPLVPQALFEGSAVLVRIGRSSVISAEDISLAFGMVGFL
jgi:hypothetical protein